MNHDDENTEHDLARLLRAAGPRETLPGELGRRWEAHFRAELASARPRPSGRTRAALGGLAAALLAALLLGIEFGARSPTPPTAEVLSVAGRVELLGADAHGLASGDTLPAGAVLASSPNSGIAIDWAGYDVRVHEDSRLLVESERLILQAGELFISDLGRQTRLRQATVVTPFGTVRDLGTQFKVRVEGDSVVASVRSGSILVESGSERERADAVAGESATLLLHRDRRVEAGDDRSDWGWIHALSRAFELEGSTVLDFLRWSAVESGQRLQFADDGVALAARSTRLSGSLDLGAIGPEQAISLVLSTTRFSALSEDGVLLVSRRSE